MEHSFQITEDILASNNMRFVNYLIDLVPQYGIVYGVIYLFFYIGEFTGNYVLNNFLTELSTIQDYIFTYTIMLGYYFFMESFANKTLGKYVTKTVVVLHNGDKPSYLDILKRSFCRLIPFDGLSFLGAKGKGWHDALSKTYVVDINKFEAKKKLQGELDQIGTL
ncbi:RDD family protein [Flavivirga aquimarina]|uniref:RDD family protein n=1 Tax=Flavivirga aquimarina TaxID=2027862 RepID=A0ABT8W843_9FLAO|nr:RDD family protein [Flavivirga aquimarina]MDO5969256.1 RDD family protein [Flavivirga aquimarina]